MVTIEQKLTLFSKLLQQDIKETLDKKAVELDEEYKVKIAKNKAKVDRQAEEIIKQAQKCAMAKKIEIISKGKMSTKREHMLVKEKYIDVFMGHLKEKIKNFIKTEDYKTYLSACIKQCESLRGYQNDLIIYMTQNDKAHYEGYIEEKLMALDLHRDKLSFAVAEESILGGIIVEDPKLNMRIDVSIEAALEDSKTYIIESVFKAIGEVGGPLE